MLGMEYTPGVKFYRGKGCDHCGKSGYKGRVGIFEILVISDPIRELIYKKANGLDISREAQRQGMKVLIKDAAEKILNGITTPEEVLRVIAPEEIGQTMKNCPKCHVPVGMDCKTCPKCQFDLEGTVCPKCGGVMEKGDTFCLACRSGKTVAAVIPESPQVPPAPEIKPEPVIAKAAPQVPPEPEITAVCPSCSSRIKSNWKICPYCHQNLQGPLKTLCPGCQEQVELDWSFCPFCQADLKAKPAEESSHREGEVIPLKREFAPTPQAKIKAGMGLKVLVVDDNPTILVLLKKILEESQLKVILASSGTDGLEKVNTQKPDLVITDTFMPGMDGFSLCRKIKNDPKIAHTPVLMLLSPNQPDESKGISSGADDFIYKPIYPDSVNTKIATAWKKLEQQSQQKGQNF